MSLTPFHWLFRAWNVGLFALWAWGRWILKPWR